MLCTSVREVHVVRGVHEEGVRAATRGSEAAVNDAAARKHLRAVAGRRDVDPRDRDAEGASRPADMPSPSPTPCVIESPTSATAAEPPSLGASAA